MPTHSNIEAQQVTDHSRDSRQDDHSSNVIDERVHRQSQQTKRCVKLLSQMKEFNDDT